MLQIVEAGSSKGHGSTILSRITGKN
jgi:hypothetical protein